MLGAMSGDGLLLASGDREPAATMFTVLTVTLGAAILNQTTLFLLVSAAAIVSQMLVAASNLEVNYRPYSAEQRSKPRRRNRKRKQNYESGTSTAGATPAVPAAGEDNSAFLPESSTVTTTADVHATGSSFPTPEMKLSRPDVVDVTGAQAAYNSFVGGDDSIVEEDEELDSGARSVRAGSRSTTSSSSSSDTDIDEIVDEFEQRRLAAVARARADDQLIDIRCADDVTHRRAVRSIVAFSISGLALFAVIAHAPRPGHPAAVVACVVAGLCSLLSVVCLSRLPARNDQVGGVMTSPSRLFNLSDLRWVALLSLAVHCCLLAVITSTSCLITLAWTTVGMYHHNHVVDYDDDDDDDKGNNNDNNIESGNSIIQSDMIPW